MTSSSNRRRNVPPPPGNAKTVYARFIPREELSSFAAWQPGDISDRAAEAPEPPPVAEPEAPPPPDPAEVLREQLHSARQSGYQDGYRDGLVALEQFKQSFSRQATAQVGAVVQSMTAQLDGLQQDMADTLARTATALARQVARAEIGQKPELIARVAEEAIEALLLSARHISVRVHPDDHTLVVQGAAELLAARGARVISDNAVTRGGCVVESDIGAIDASIETRWSRAVATLGSAEPWQIPTAPAPAATDKP